MLMVACLCMASPLSGVSFAASSADSAALCSGQPLSCGADTTTAYPDAAAADEDEAAAEALAEGAGAAAAAADAEEAAAADISRRKEERAACHAREEKRRRRSQTPALAYKSVSQWHPHSADALPYPALPTLSTCSLHAPRARR